MWWRSARSVLLAIAVASVLGGCGFHPMYGSHSGTATPAVRDQMALVHISTIRDRTGQILRDNLIQRINPNGEPSAPKYTLTITLNEGMGGINFQKNATSSGGEMSIAIDWTLFDNASGLIISHGSISSIDSVNYLGPRYASVAVERDGEGRLLTDIADILTDRVAVQFAGGYSQAQPAKAPAGRTQP